MRRSLVVGMSLFSLCLLFSGMAVAKGVGSECDAVPDNVVANCGFETGAFRPEWTLSGVNPASVGTYAHSGNFAIGMYSDSGLGGHCLSQMLTTVPDRSYDLSYWLAQNYDPNFVVFWNGAAIDYAESFDEQPFTQRLVLGLTGTGADTLTFCDSSAAYSFVWIDDIVVIPSPATP